MHTYTLHTYSHHSQLCFQLPVWSCVPAGMIYKNMSDNTSYLAFKTYISGAVLRPAGY